MIHVKLQSLLLLPIIGPTDSLIIKQYMLLLSSLSLWSGVRLAPIPVVDLYFPFIFTTCSVLLPCLPIVSIPLYPSPSFSIPLPLSRSPPISVSVFSVSIYYDNHNLQGGRVHELDCAYILYILYSVFTT